MLLCLLVEGESSGGRTQRAWTSASRRCRNTSRCCARTAFVTTRREAQTIYYMVAPGPAQRDHLDPARHLLRARSGPVQMSGVQVEPFFHADSNT